MATNIDLCPFTKMHDGTRKALKNFSHPAVEEIDNFGMYENTFFAHLKPPYYWNDRCHLTVKSFTSVGEMKEALKGIEKC